jgi:hypothetical protein
MWLVLAGVDRSNARFAGAVWLGCAGCLAPTAFGLRHDGFIGVPGTVQGGVAVVQGGGLPLVDLTASATVLPDVQIAGAVGYIGSTHAEAEVRFGGTPAVGEPSFTVSIGAGAWFAGDDSDYGVHTRLVLARPVAPKLRLYGGLAINPVVGPSCGTGSFPGCGVAVYAEPAVGLSFRRIGAHGWTQAVGVEFDLAIVLAEAGWDYHVFGPSWTSPFLTVWGEVGRTPARPVPRPPAR